MHRAGYGGGGKDIPETTGLATVLPTA